MEHVNGLVIIQKPSVFAPTQLILFTYQQIEPTLLMCYPLSFGQKRREEHTPPYASTGWVFAFVVLCSKTNAQEHYAAPHLKASPIIAFENIHVQNINLAANVRTYAATL